jgi:hypothetical protein
MARSAETFPALPGAVWRLCPHWQWVRLGVDGVQPLSAPGRACDCPERYAIADLVARRECQQARLVLDETREHYFRGHYGRQGEMKLVEAYVAYGAAHRALVEVWNGRIPYHLWPAIEADLLQRIDPYRAAAERLFHGEAEDAS